MVAEGKGPMRTRQAGRFITKCCDAAGDSKTRIRMSRKRNSAPGHAVTSRCRHRIGGMTSSSALGPGRSFMERGDPWRPSQWSHDTKKKKTGTSWKLPLRRHPTRHLAQDAICAPACAAVAPASHVRQIQLALSIQQIVQKTTKDGSFSVRGLPGLSSTPPPMPPPRGSALVHHIVRAFVLDRL